MECGRQLIYQRYTKIKTVILVGQIIVHFTKMLQNVSPPGGELQ